MQKNAVEVIVITAPWDHFRQSLNELCNEVMGQGINCQVMDYTEPRAMQLLLRQGTEDGMVRIPKILILINNRIVEVKYQVREDLVSNMKEETLRIIRTLQLR